MTSVARALAETRTALRNFGVENADLEARELVSRALACPPAVLARRLEDAWAGRDGERLAVLLERRRAAPLAQVLGEWDFRGKTFEVTPDVLIPRPETEELVGWAAERAEPETRSIVDVGTGSGCIAVCLAEIFPAARLWAVDPSERALAVAKRNAGRFRVAEKIQFLRGDLLTAWSGRPGVLDLVIANLPYVSRLDMAGLDPMVLREPALALDGGEDGLELIGRLVPQAFAALAPGGELFLEVGYNQAASVSRFLTAGGFADAAVRRDMAGKDRFLRGRKA